MKKTIMVAALLAVCVGAFIACSSAFTANSNHYTEPANAQTTAAQQASSGSSNNLTLSMATTRGKITIEQAKEIALNHAQINEDQITHFEADLEFDDGRTEYELEFRFNNLEYNYDIDAFTGEIVGYEIDN